MSPFARHTLSIAALALSFSVLPAANAAVITENFTYGGPVEISGSITFDTAVYEGNGNQLSYGDINALSMTVSGATAGNGTYSLADFNNIFFSSGAVFDWNAPLFGQGGWGPGGSGTFSFVSAGVSAAPNGSGPFEMTTAGGDITVLTSMAPPAPAAPVPEPETYMLMGIASAALAYARRRNTKKQQGTAEVQPSGLLAA